VSTTGDLAAFLAALFGGRLISDAVLAEMTVPGPEGYGLGLATGVDFSFGPGRVGYGHGGAIPGYQASMSIEPDSGDTLVVPRQQTKTSGSTSSPTGSSRPAGDDAARPGPALTPR